jgi:DegV family protein with EDD domain
MSGTFESARTAAKSIDIPVHVADSKSNSMSLGWQLLACAREREKGGGVSEMLAAVEKVRTQLHYHIVLDTLEYLFKGGRIAGAAKLLNNVLKIKPQIRVNHNSGTVEPGDISRTRVKAIESLYVSFFKKLDITKPLRIAVLHNDALEEAKILAEKIKLEFHPVELIIGIVSPVLGVHTGPRAIALCGYNE